MCLHTDLVIQNPSYMHMHVHCAYVKHNSCFVDVKEKAKHNYISIEFIENEKFTVKSTNQKIYLPQDLAHWPLQQTPW